jgi:hypothetical protein
MQLKEIIDCFGDLKIHEKRCMEDDFVELVFFSDEIDEWHRILKAFLGSPIKPQGQEPSTKDLELTAGTGSIRINQTLYEKDTPDAMVIAKFWPWDDNIHITLRMALLLK